MDYEDAILLVKKAEERERDDRLWLQWAIQLPTMAFGEYVSFQDYKDRITGANVDKRPTAEILAELDELEQKFGGATDGA